MAGEHVPEVDPVIAPVVAAVETPVAAPEPSAPVAAPAEPAPQHPAEIPTLLETLKAPGTEKPADKPEEKAADAPKPPEAKVEAKPEEKKPDAETPKAPEPVVEAPVEYKFEFPEHVKPEAAKVEAFTTLAREAKMSPEQAQKAIGLFNEAATNFIAEQQRNQVKVWNETRADWRNKAKADPMIGGAGHLHAMGVIARTRDLIISDAQPGTPQYDRDAKEVEDFLRITGAGDHPTFLKMLYRAGGRLDEPRMVTAVPSPTKTNGVRPSRSLYAPTPK